MSKAKHKKKGGTQDLCRLFQDMPTTSEGEEGYPPDYPFGKKKFINKLELNSILHHQNNYQKFCLIK